MSNKERSHLENCIFRIQFSELNQLKDSTPFIVKDESGGDHLIQNYGNDHPNYKYNFKSMGFSNKIEKVIQEEKISHVRQTPIASIKGLDQVSVRDSKHEKFIPITKSSVNIFSFEKSVFQAISRDMLNFISGVKSFNNLIGEPVNKYRKNYKLLNHVRERYFSNVLSEPDFERYLNYYKWVDASFGYLLKQMVPASAFSNTGIEDVIESHAFERNKYDYKYNRFERKEPILETSILSINELLYDWEHGHGSQNENEHCLWQQDRKTREEENRETIRKVLTTVVTGSGEKLARNYVLRNLVKPYKHDSSRQLSLKIGHNRQANKIKDLYKIINTGKEITINSEDIYEFKRCDDIINPQKDKIYTAKTNTSDTDGYLDADLDLILPLNFYSSSVGVDFSEFKQNLKITNNLEMKESFDSVATYLFDQGAPHRNVKIGTPSDNRPEAYEISSSPEKLVIKSPASGPKSLFHKGHLGNRLYRLSNTKTQISDTQVLVQGNYSKDYEIVMTNGRNQNNNFLTENEGRGLTGSLSPSGWLSGLVDFEVPSRPKREHVIVNRFSAIGSPDTSGKYGLDRVSEEHSVYNTVNYRSLLVRGVYNTLSKERSEQFGFRSGSETQGSIHKTNRNYNRFTGSYGKEVTPDNFFATHQIPHHDFGYSWITASANENVYSFLNRNGNISHQHSFEVSGSLKSSETILFLTASVLGTDSQPAGPYYAIENTDLALPPWSPVSFVGLNTVIQEPISADLNHLGFPMGTPFGRTDVDISTLAGSRVMTNIDGYYEYYLNNDTLAGIQSPHTDLASGLNSLILKRQGPYGWPTWKQVRASHNPIVRNHRRNNIISAVFRGTTPFPSCYPGTSFEYQNTNENKNTITNRRVVKNYDEILATCKFNPITVSRHTYRTETGIEFLMEHLQLPVNVPQWALALMWWNDEFLHEFITKTESLNTVLQLPSISMRVPLQNTVTGYANQDMADDFFFKEKSILNTTNIGIINSFIKTEANNADSTFLEVNYIETIYPREINTFTKEARNRELFDFFGWNSNRTKRELTLSGNITYGDWIWSTTVWPGVNLFTFSLESPTQLEVDFEKSYFNSYEKIDRLYFPNTASEYSENLKTSKWVLDSRKDYSSLPTEITNPRSWVQIDATKPGSLVSRAQMQTGILQNEFSMFPLGGNALRGQPPFAPVYNRRIPQEYLSSSTRRVLLAGEAKWETPEPAPGTTGPFLDEYEEFQKEARLVGQQYSLIPEFTISRYIEDIYASGNFTTPSVGDDFLQLTGAVYHSSSGEVSIGTQFFKTYSNSDFMKYFQPFKDNITENGFDLSAGKLSLRCTAVKRLLPYRGFYPAERAVQIVDIFQKNYLSEGTYEIDYLQNGFLTEQKAKDSLKIKINNTKAKVSKPLFSPGVLFNSIKSGLAVDYPLFQSNTDTYRQGLIDNSVSTHTEPFDVYNYLDSPGDLCYTGSLINNTADLGIPRIKGVVPRRVTFEDLLDPVRLFGQTIFENEPHSSASFLYGTPLNYVIREDQPKFGTLDSDYVRLGNTLNFRQNYQSSVESLRGYTSAIHNFASETVKFFLEDESLQTAISLPSRPTLQSGTDYKMRVYVNNRKTVMYDRHSAFGPPVDDADTPVISYGDDVKTPGAQASGSVAFRGAMVTALRSGGSASGGEEIVITDYENTTINYTFFSGSSNKTGDVVGTDPYAVAVEITDAGSEADLLVQAMNADGHKDTISKSITTGSEGMSFLSDFYTVVLHQSATGSAGNKDMQGTSAIDSYVVGLLGGVDQVLNPLLKSTSTIKSGSHGHLPYVPPFLDPETAPYAQISFTPGQTREYTIPEIIEGMQVSYYNMPPPDNSNTNTNYREAMVLSASINFNNSVLLYGDNYVHLGSATGEKTIVNNPDPTLYRWVMQPKWETPIIDFMDAKVTALDLSTEKEEYVQHSPWKNRYQTDYYKEINESKTLYLTSSTGMWHQHGSPTVLDPNKGYYLTIVGASETTGKQTIGNLAEKVGFISGYANNPIPASLTYSVPQEAQPFRSLELGRVAKEKVISEAVVAIPYYLTDDCDMKFFPMREDMMLAATQKNAMAREEYVNLTRLAGTDQERKNIKNEYEKFFESVGLESIDAAAYQMRMMDKYILPPQFDFLRNSEIDPYVSYIFQFKATLSREDLSEIWQNLYPSTNRPGRPADSISTTQHSNPLKDEIKSDIEYITHILNHSRAPFIKGKPSLYRDPETFLENDVRWLIFKVKYRAEGHYSNVIKNSITDLDEDIMEISASRTFGPGPTYGKMGDPVENEELFSNYSYNWPYDFFSIIEMIKVESKVDFLTTKENIQTTARLSSETASPSSPLSDTINAAEQVYSNNVSDITQNLNSTVLNNIVSRELIKSDSEISSTPGVLDIPVASGFSIKKDTETIFLNGQLLVAGSGNDYVVSGNRITFSQDLEINDNVQVSYIRE